MKYKTFETLKSLEKPLIVGLLVVMLHVHISLGFLNSGEANVEKELVSVSVTQVSAAEISPLAPVFLGIETPLDETHAIVGKQKEFVSTRKAYSASLAVITKHEETIRKYARLHGVPEDLALGIGLLENGGSETAVSSAGALGVFQLMPGTARNLGLTVNKSIDERRDPEKNIDAGIRYLKKNYDRFGDWGLSAWAYHAGEGNVVKALKAYARANHEITLPGVKNFRAHREYVAEYEITIHKLLSDPSVQAITQKLNDDSSGYPYKVIATSKLFQESKI